ncbi:MAG: succinylglutamate desuccinylase [Geminicoccaceae bacterium]
MPDPIVEIAVPDLGKHRQGNTDIRGVNSFEAERAGPHVVITALVHGNELCGAWAISTLLEREIRPCRGRISLALVNTAAFSTFDPNDPKASRYLDEDLNRVWTLARLDGPRRSAELDRAREIRPLIERADYLLDIHSMQTTAPPLALTGLTAKGRRLAAAMGFPGCVVADSGHRNGARMRDFGAFADPESPRTAILVECGQHWAKSSVAVAIAACRQFLAALEVVPPEMLERLGAAPARQPQRMVEVTEAVTVTDGGFRFADQFHGLEVIPEGGTVIAHDGARPIRTPYDDCVLIMPSRRLAPGLTAVRLGRFVD